MRSLEKNFEELEIGIEQYTSTYSRHGVLVQ